MRTKRLRGLTTAEYCSAKYYALRFPEWLNEYNALKDSVSAISYENADMPKPVNKTGNPTESLAMRRDELRAKMDLIIECSEKASGDLNIQKYILKSVTEGLTFEQVNKWEHVPCCANVFYKHRRQFYFLLANRM